MSRLGSASWWHIGFRQDHHSEGPQHEVIKSGPARVLGTAGNPLRAVGGSQAASSSAKDATTLLTFKEGFAGPNEALATWKANTDCCHWTVSLLHRPAIVVGCITRAHLRICYTSINLRLDSSCQINVVSTYCQPFDADCCHCNPIQPPSSSNCCNASQERHQQFVKPAQIWDCMLLPKLSGITQKIDTTSCESLSGIGMHQCWNPLSQIILWN